MALSRRASCAELPQVVVQVFIHSAAPGLRGQVAKKGMRMPGAFGFPTFVKLSHTAFELLLFTRKLALIRYHEFRVCGAVA